MSKVKLYTNPARGQTKPVAPYVPVYKSLGIVPEKAGTTQNIPTRMPVAPQRQQQSEALENPRMRSGRPNNVAFSEAPPPKTIESGRFPNTGNNMESAWISIDGEDFNDVIIEDGNLNRVKLDPNQQMVDNNFDDEKNYQNIPRQMKPPPVQEYTVEASDVESVSNFDIADDEYVLVVFDSIVNIGAMEVIQEEVSRLLFGDHELNQNNSITQENIIVLKRVKIKVGVFLE